MKIFLGLMIPFFGTTAGAACVFFMKKKIRPFSGKLMMGFASGVMVAASVWSLLIPAIHMAQEMGRFAFFPAISRSFDRNGKPAAFRSFFTTFLS